MGIWSAPMDVFGNALDNLQETPQINHLMLGFGLAHDAALNVPVDLLSTIPHYATEVKSSGRNSAAVQSV
jgi:hypothetical protein